MPAPKKDIPFDQAKQKYEGGATLAQLAEEYECAPSTVRTTLTAGGVQMRPRGGRKRVPADA